MADTSSIMLGGIRGRRNNHTGTTADRSSMCCMGEGMDGTGSRGPLRQHRGGGSGKLGIQSHGPNHALTSVPILYPGPIPSRAMGSTHTRDSEQHG